MLDARGAHGDEDPGSAESSSAIRAKPGTAATVPTATAARTMTTSIPYAELGANEAASAGRLPFLYWKGLRLIIVGGIAETNGRTGLPVTRTWRQHNATTGTLPHFSRMCTLYALATHMPSTDEFLGPYTVQHVIFHFC